MGLHVLVALASACARASRRVWPAILACSRLVTCLCAEGLRFVWRAAIGWAGVNEPGMHRGATRSVTWEGLVPDNVHDKDRQGGESPDSSGYRGD